MDQELQKAEQRKQEMVNWLSLDYTKRITGKWKKELDAAQHELITLRPEQFNASVLYLVKIAKLQERIMLRKSLVEEPETALLVKQKIVEHLEGTVEEHE